MHIHDGRLIDDAGRPARFVRANAHGGKQDPRYVVIHDTAGHDRKFSSVEWFASKQCPHSAHFVVERDGTITQMVETDKRAWHAGESAWKGVRYLNSCSVGIEIVNPGKMDSAGKAWFGHGASASEIERKVTKEHGDGYWLPYTPEQIAAVTAICKAVVAEYPDCNEIVTHWEISPKRKIDTNPLFPLAEVRRAVFDPEPVVPVTEVAAATVQPTVESPPVVAEPSLVKTALKSKSVRYLGGGMLAWIEAKLGFLREALPAAHKEATEIVDPLTGLAGLLKANIEAIAFGIVAVTLIVVMVRHTRDKAELTKLKGE